ncbi:MAG TPA: DJ-1/PfpI family protein [Caulobacteraceae bacterium]|jgi:putative intracellular protease/amidase
MTRVVAFFQPGWADWEAAPILSLLREYMGGEIRIATPDRGPQTSIGGVRAAADAAFADIGPGDADLFLAIGSDAWPGYHDEAFFDLLRGAVDGGAIVGAICAGTVAAARAGLFEGRAHTSNGREWLSNTAPGYAGVATYVDTPKAVSDGRVVSAPGSAPQTFASEIARLIAPGSHALLLERDLLMQREWTG